MTDSQSSSERDGGSQRFRAREKASRYHCSCSPRQPPASHGGFDSHRLVRRDRVGGRSQSPRSGSIASGGSDPERRRARGRTWRERSCTPHGQVGSAKLGHTVSGQRARHSGRMHLPSPGSDIGGSEGSDRGRPVHRDARRPSSRSRWIGSGSPGGGSDNGEATGRGGQDMRRRSSRGGSAMSGGTARPDRSSRRLHTQPRSRTRSRRGRLSPSRSRPRSRRGRRSRSRSRSRSQRHRHTLSRSRSLAPHGRRSRSHSRSRSPRDREPVRRTLVGERPSSRSLGGGRLDSGTSLPLEVSDPKRLRVQVVVHG